MDRSATFYIWYDELIRLLLYVFTKAQPTVAQKLLNDTQIVWQCTLLGPVINHHAEDEN